MGGRGAFIPSGAGRPPPRRVVRAAAVARAAAAAAAAPPADAADTAACRAAPSPTRRALLGGACVGGLHGWAGRAAAAADASPPPAAAPPSEAVGRRLERQVSEFQLANGMRFLVLERRAAPVVSCVIYADVGAFEEDEGQTGVAHLLEHMAFKGTRRVGTTDAAAEAPLLDAADDAFYELRAATGARERARAAERLADASAAAAAYSVPNAYGALLAREGAVGLNASTSHDATQYTCSLPANKLELWFALEAERFQAPVFRELYTEKAVVLEERRLRVDGAPLGAFHEAFLQAALANNYRRPVIGFAPDIEGLGRREVDAFFRRHYTPATLTVGIAGDVRPGDARRWAEQYFGGWQAGAERGGGGAAAAAADPAAAAVAEPLPVPQRGGRRELTARSRAGPLLHRTYWRPGAAHPDGLALDAASDLLTGTRSSRLYRALVLGGLAAQVTSVSAYPGDKHAGLFAVSAVPSAGRTLAEVDAAVGEQLAALAGKGPAPAEMVRYRKAATVSLLGALGSNQALAGALCSYSVLRGSWRGIAADLAGLEAMRPEAVRDAAAQYLAPGNSFAGLVLPAA